ncbi:hypothetical protein N7455_011301 [Penicillium solitum]|uniref:uncharacterized protein n=1 Tax=Penicillium solitum TaxID=60172 RepID=UPI0032C4636C|nr:hypothetical protein N7455_011301 [Penicillium solitum]
MQERHSEFQAIDFMFHCSDTGVVEYFDTVDKTWKFFPNNRAVPNRAPRQASAQSSSASFSLPNSNLLQRADTSQLSQLEAGDLYHPNTGIIKKSQWQPFRDAWNRREGWAARHPLALLLGGTTVSVALGFAGSAIKG